MKQKLYKIMDNTGHCLAASMDLQMALLFMKAYCEEYYNERIKLTLELMEESSCNYEIEPKEYEFK